MACSTPMTERPQREWLQVQALQCIGLALRAKDPRIKRLYTLEAQRWLRLAELKVRSFIRDGRAAEYRGAERRMTPRHQSPKDGVILLERAFRVECVVRDFSPAGVGLLLPDIINLPNGFYLSFDYGVRRCITVWRQLDRVGVMCKSIARAWRPGG
jgi:hypothetical protein